MADLPEETGHEMTQGYLVWNQAPQVSNLREYLKKKYPDATLMELDNHILHYTLVKLVVWLQPDADSDTGKKEPWEM